MEEAELSLLAAPPVPFDNNLQVSQYLLRVS